MSAKNEIRENVAYTVLAASLVLFMAGSLAGEGWRFFLYLLAGPLLLLGGVMAFSLNLIKGVPWIVRLLSRHAEPVWEGEILYTDGGYDKVRYLMKADGPIFVARDVCLAIGVRAPTENAPKWGGVPLLLHEDEMYFSESGVQEYLLPLAEKNRDANRLLVLVRNNVLRKLNKQRELDTIYSPRADTPQ